MTMLLSECPVEHSKCRITYPKNNAGLKEVCMCWCHEHAKPSPREPDPIIGIGRLNDRPDVK
jgi:hypothetical protein